MAGKHRSIDGTRSRRTAATLLAAVAMALAVVTAGVIGTGGTYAAWSANVTLPGATLQTGTAGLQLGGVTALTRTLASPSSSSAVVTITNSGTAPLRRFTTSATLATGSSTALASAVKLSIWPVANGTTTCPAPPTSPAPATGSWATAPQWLAAQGPLAAGATASYCFLSSISSADWVADANTTATVSVTATGTTGADGSGWSGSTTQSFTLTDPPASTSGAIDNNNTAGTSLTVTRSAGANGAVCFAMHVTSTDGSKNPWQLTIHTSSPVFLGVPFASWTWPQGTASFEILSGPDAQGNVVIDGVGGTTGSNGTGNTKFVQAGAPYDLTFCVRSTS